MPPATFGGMSARFSPRVLAPWETPRRGDIFFEKGSSWAARLTQWGTRSHISHVGAIARVWDGGWTAIETRGKVVAEMPVTSMTGYVVRLSDDPVEIERFLNVCYSMLGVSYDWAAIGRFAVRALRERWWSRWLGAILDLFVPDRDNELAIICSDHICRAIQAVWGTDLVPVDPTAVAPIDLFRAIVGFQQWIGEGSGYVPQVPGLPAPQG